MKYIVEGPAGCGKTRNAERIAKYLGCKSIVEGDEYRNGIGAFTRLKKPVLILTQCADRLPSYIRKRATVKSFDSLQVAMRGACS